MIHMKFHHSYLKLFIIHFACCLKLTEVLIEHGCNVNARNFQGDTALHVMVKRNRLSCAVVLLSHNAYTDIQNADGNTPLHLAVKVMLYFYLTYSIVLYFVKYHCSRMCMNKPHIAIFSMIMSFCNHD